MSRDTVSPVPNYGKLMTIGEWIDQVHSGMFTDYDGTGCYASRDPERMADMMYHDTEVRPSDVKANMIDLRHTHIVWFNK